MNLHKLRSNSTDLLQTIPYIIKEKENVHMFSVPEDCNKALGMHWHTTKDTLHVATPIIKKRVYVTKRQILSDVAKTFDIFGVVCSCHSDCQGATLTSLAVKHRLG